MTDKSSTVKIIVISLIATAVIAYIVINSKSDYRPIVVGDKAPSFVLPLLGGGKIKLMKKYPNTFRMYAISIDSSDVPDIVIKYMKENGLSFPVLLDTKGRVKELYKTTGVPETYIVNKKGIVAVKIIGPRDWYNPTNYQPIESLIVKD